MQEENTFSPYKTKWEAIARSTLQDSSMEEAEHGIRMLYDALFLKAPSTIIWCDGPIKAAKALKVQRQPFGKFLLHMIKSLDERVTEDIRLSFRSSGHKISDYVTFHLNTFMFRDYILNNVPRRMRQHLNPNLILVDRVGWLAIYDFSSDFEISETASRLKGLTKVLKNTALWYAFEDTAVLVKKPEILKFDEGSFLHSAVGPAFRFKDGFEGYYWKGTEVPKEWILSSKDLDPTIALNWANIEQRRCAAEIIGWKKVLELLPTKVINTNPDPTIGTLLEVKLGTRRERFLQVLCGTGRTFCIPVPKSVKTAQAAQNWIWQWDSKLPKPEVRT